MQRSRKNTVTEIPILIPCSPDEQEGDLILSGALSGPVRELSDKTRRKFLNAMHGQQLKHFAAVAQLMRAVEDRDHVAATDALKRLSEVRAKGLGQVGDYPPHFGQLLAPYYGLKPQRAQEAIEIFEGRRMPPSTATRPEKVLSLEVAEKLTQVHLGLWLKGKRFTPALYCSDPKAAPYVYILANKRWNVCPHCGKWFLKDRPDQDYCTVAHRETHRVARWRKRQQQLGNQKKSTRGGQHVTRKTR